MVKYYVNKEVYCFTVYTQDAINADADQRLGGTASTTNYVGGNPGNKNRRKFTFRLPSSSRIGNSNRAKVAIESIWANDQAVY